MGRGKKKIALDQGRAVAYLRTSTDHQAVSLEAQRAAIDAWAASHGVEVVGEFRDVGVSGAADLRKRGGLIDAMGTLRDLDAGLLLVTRRDRLARSVGVALAVDRAVEEAGARVVAVEGGMTEDTAESRLIRTVIDAVAEYERALIRLRIRAAAKVRQARGQYTGGVAPFGFTVEPKTKALCPHPVQHPVLLRMMELRGLGYSANRIAKYLTERGVKTATGQTKWTAAVVQNSLDSFEDRTALQKAG